MKVVKDGVEYDVDVLEMVDRTDGRWGYWSCDVTKPDGTVVDGGIEGDGDSWAHETLEIDV